MSLQKFVVEFRINPDWTEQVQCEAHDFYEVARTSRQQLLEDCGRVAFRQAELIGITPISG